VRDVSTITVDLLRARGVSLAFVARQSRMPYARLQRALNGAGLGSLEPEESNRVFATLARFGLLADVEAEHA